jgi:tetratricopeptide (TPR) repeat protein
MILRRPWALVACLLFAATARAEDRDRETDWGPEQAAGRRAFKEGKFAEAEVLLTKALERARTEGIPVVDLSRSLQWRGSARRMQAKFADAEADLQAALAIRVEHPGRQRALLRQTLTELGILESMRGRFGAAAGYHRRSLDIAEAFDPPDYKQLANSRNNLGELYRKLLRFDLAEPLLLASIADYERPENAGDMQIAWPLNNLGLLRHLQGRQEESMALHRRALAIWEAHGGQDHPDVALSLKNVALVLNAQKKYAEAEAAANRSLEIRETRLGKDHPAVAQTLVVLGTIARDQGQVWLATARYVRALEIRERRLGKDHLDVAETLEPYSALLRSLGRTAEADEAAARAKAIRDANAIPDLPAAPK